MIKLLIRSRLILTQKTCSIRKKYNFSKIFNKSRQNKNDLEQKQAGLLKQFHKRFKQSHQTEQPKIFAQICRRYSVILRHITFGHTSDLTAILGQNYQLMLKLNVNSFNILQLIDIVTFLPLHFDKKFFNIADPKLKNFVNQILLLIIKKYNQRQDHQRTLSYLIKAARCAILFKNQIYSDFIQLILKNLQKQADFYKSLAVLNFISLNTPKNIEIQIKILAQMLTLGYKNNWATFMGVHQTIDFFIKATDLINSHPYIFSLKQPFNRMLVQLRQAYNRQYQNMSGQQIVRIVKLFSKVDQSQEIFAQILKFCFNAIKPDGSCSVNPIFVIRLILYCKNYSQYSSYVQNWQQKFIKLMQYYIVQQNVAVKLVLDGIYRSLYEGMFSYSNTIIMCQLLYKKFTDWTWMKSNSIQVRMLLAQFLLALKYQNYEIAKFLLKNYSSIIKLQKPTYLTYINIQFSSTMLSHFGLFPINKTRLAVPSELTKIQNINKMPTLNYLQLINKLYPLANNQKITTSNLLIFTHIIQSLPYNLMYDQFIQLLPSLTLNPTLNEVLNESLHYLPFPLKYQQNILQSMQHINKDPTIYSYRLFNLLSQTQKLNARCTTAQAKYYIRVISSVPIDKRLHFYSDNLIIEFLMIFSKQEFTKEIQKIFQEANIEDSSQRQYLYLRMLSNRGQHSDDFRELKQFQKGVGKLGYSCQKISQFHCNVLLENFLMTRQEILQKYPRYNIDSYTANEKKSQYQRIVYQLLNAPTGQKKNYMKSYPQSTDFNNLISEYLKLLQSKIQKQTDKNQLLKTYIRIVRINKQQIFNSISQQAKSKLREKLQQLALDTQTSAVWCFKALKLSAGMNWIMPSVFAHAVKLAHLQLSYRGKIVPQQILYLLVKYPIQNKWNVQLATTIMNLVNFYCPDQIGFVADQISKIEDQKICTLDMRKYINYILQKVGSNK